jgi:rhodanese-related sulfurtransferase
MAAHCTVLLSDDEELTVDGPLVPPESCLPSTLDLIAGSVRRWFPSIRHMPAIELAARLAAVHAGAGGAHSTSGAQLLLLDVREPAEFSVSHIPGAVNVCPSPHTSHDAVRAIVSSAMAQSDTSEVVCYCSVGVRSSQLALAISTVEPSWTHRIHNLDGSIFRWANQGRQLVDNAGQPTATVHPYSSLWGRLVRPDLHSWGQR